MSKQKLPAINNSRNQILANQVSIADNFFTRLRGLLFTKSLPEGNGLLIKPCNSIHMFGMAYAIDAIFLSKDNIVVDTLSDLQPGKLSRIYWEAESCLELPTGTVMKTGTQTGDQLQFADQ